jgi:hypothetical protein
VPLVNFVSIRVRKARDKNECIVSQFARVARGDKVYVSNYIVNHCLHYIHSDYSLNKRLSHGDVIQYALLCFFSLIFAEQRAV